MQEVQTALENTRLAATEVEVYEQEILPRVIESLEAIRQAYLLGEVDLTEVILLKKDLMEAQRGYLNALASYISARSDLEAAMGIRYVEALRSDEPRAK